ncbi:MAG: tRNA (adenosine(37)-N6)-dimethylallyltransferase MiaA [Burkholderiaceae bacterium]|nr:tRNA (adenosine(37)-N6)-dimethylallyltransferase MiaA [Pseudomonadota bacterium]MBS0597852.1 tRNA (adenosine(37)-N6)-dimethylallyltransferase MiaA [Pseudomonadota bacterium]MCP5219204.1 tRNA (adenosine(37)-N6)-dimethylallyltransferase MiaA [Burkholderiaceae bacterium]
MDCSCVAADIAPPTIQALCLAGPTASGKSALALALAERVPVEIISVDSALVYRGLDIGTAKPTPAERAAVPHHLIDIREPTETYSAADFARDATRLVTEIRARGRLPLLVGGTLLYFKALLEGLDELPPADAAVRRRLDERARQHGWPALHAELARVDPQAAARLPATDSQRIQRALEVWQLTGRPLSSFHTTKTRAAGADQTGAMPLFSLEPTDRAALQQRIAQRFDAMLAAGLLEEVEALRARSNLTPDLPALRCVGYRQAWQALDEGWPIATLRERGIIATRQLAKRQLTWLRSLPGRRVLPTDDAHPAQAQAWAAPLAAWLQGRASQPGHAPA